MSHMWHRIGMDYHRTRISHKWFPYIPWGIYISIYHEFSVVAFASFPSCERRRSHHLRYCCLHTDAGVCSCGWPRSFGHRCRRSFQRKLHRCDMDLKGMLGIHIRLCQIRPLRHWNGIRIYDFMLILCLGVLYGWLLFFGSVYLCLVCPIVKAHIQTCTHFGNSQWPLGK